MKSKSPAGVWWYRGVPVYPAPLNSSGMRWSTVRPSLRSDTKEGMRLLIKATVAPNGGTDV